MKVLLQWKIDLKQVMRDPIMRLLVVAPLLIIILFKCLLVFAVPYLVKLTGFDLSPYYSYLFTFIMLLIPGMLGMVTGFAMIDDKDGLIAELLSVTPLGRYGYIFNRLSLGAILSILYCLMGYFILNLTSMPFISLILLLFMMAVYSAISGLLLFLLADDKVKGLTLAKGLNTLSLFAFSDILALPWLTKLSWFFPTYWTSRIVRFPDNLPEILIFILCHLVWLGVLIKRGKY